MKKERKGKRERKRQKKGGKEGKRKKEWEVGKEGKGEGGRKERSQPRVDYIASVMNSR